MFEKPAKFKCDPLLHREVVQTSVLNPLKKLTVDNKVVYTGKLTFPRSSTPADMIVKFPLSKNLGFDFFNCLFLSTLKSQISA